LDQEAVQGGCRGPWATRSHWEIVLAVQDAKTTRGLTKGSGSHIATTRQQEGARPNFRSESFGERQRKSIGNEKPLGNRLGGSRCNRASAPLQRIMVAHCDYSKTGGRWTQSLTMKLRRASLEVQWSRQGMRKACQKVKRQDGVGESPRGQCRTLRPYDSWKAPDDISDQEASENVKGGQ